MCLPVASGDSCERVIQLPKWWRPTHRLRTTGSEQKDLPKVMGMGFSVYKGFWWAQKLFLKVAKECKECK